MIRNTIMFLLLAATTHAAPKDTCLVQSRHISVNITSVTGGANGVVKCPGLCSQFRVCLTLKNLGGNPLSHTCVKPSNQCPLLVGFEPYDAQYSSEGYGEMLNPGEGFQQCQIGSSGMTLYFLLKDGSGCLKNGVTDYAVIPDLDVGDSGYTTVAECRSRTGWGNANVVIDSCTGNRPSMECVWAVKLPQASCGEFPVIPFDKDCDQCAPPNQECRNEVNSQPPNSVAYDITDCKNPLQLQEDLKDYGCELSKIPNCNVIICQSFVPLDAFMTETTTYDVMQCPLYK